MGEKSDAVAGGTVSPTGRKASVRWNVSTRWRTSSPPTYRSASCESPRSTSSWERSSVNRFQSMSPREAPPRKKAGTPHGVLELKSGWEKPGTAPRAVTVSRARASDSPRNENPRSANAPNRYDTGSSSVPRMYSRVKYPARRSARIGVDMDGGDTSCRCPDTRLPVSRWAGANDWSYLKAWS